MPLAACQPVHACGPVRSTIARTLADKQRVAPGEMNDHRRVHEKWAILLESSQARLIRAIVELLYDQITLTPASDGGE